MATTRRVRTHRPRHGALAGLAVAALVLVGCGDDDEPSAGSDPTTTAEGDTTSAPADDGGLGAELEAELQAVVDETVEELGVPGAVVLVTRPDARWETAVGVGDLETEEPLETGLRWPLRSITKSFTATLALQLADEGEIDLDAPVATYVEGVPNGDVVTVRQLMDMTSGLPDYTGEAFVDAFVEDPERQFTLDELIAFATAEPPRAEPGTDRVYTNSNTLLLGKVVEEATGQPFEEVLTERIIEPLGLDETVYPTSPDQWAADTTGYSPGDDGELSPEPVNYSVFGPAGAMITTMDDLATWAAALASGELVEPDTQERREEGAPLDEGPEYDQYAEGIGELDGWWGHTGEGFGYTALAMHDTATESSVVIGMNAAGLEDGHGSTILFRRLAPLLA